MGVVYKARQIRLNRLCALKIALPGKHTGAESRARFLAEAETIARLRHPNIVQIYGLGEHEGLAYFEMEYIEGGSLARRLDGTPWAPGPAARMVAVLARAIGDAHRLGIVHRDLKPGNVLLKDDETPKVVDFGLAKSLEADSNLTQSGVFLGTPSYAAPEQVEGRSVGPAADIYALGAIFYHMLTGRPPFQAATVLQTLDQVKTADPVPPSRLQPGLPRDAETIALKCLEKDPHRRYADAAALAEDLDRFLAGRPILARPTGAAERLRKWVRRRPAVALLSAAVVGGHHPGLHPGRLAMAARGSQGRRGRPPPTSRRAAGTPRRVRGRGPAHVPPGTGPVRPGRGGARPLVAGPQPGAGRGSQVGGPRPTDSDQPGRLGGPTEPTPAVTADAASGADPGARLPPRGQGARLGGRGWRRPHLGHGHRKRDRTAAGAQGRSRGRPAGAGPIRPGGERPAGDGR